MIKVYDLLDTYYQRQLSEAEKQAFYRYTRIPLEQRPDGIYQELQKLLDEGCDIDETHGGFNALMTAVGCGDASMTEYLIKHGADPNKWPDMENDLSFEEPNYYLEDIDINYMNESFANEKDYHFMEALFDTAVVLANVGHLGPYQGTCHKIDEAGNVSVKYAEPFF